MPILLDEQPLDIQADDLGDVLNQVRDRIAPEGRIITEVKIDGRPLASNDLQALRHVPVVAVEVALASAKARDLAIETIGQAREQLYIARDVQDDAADALQEDNTTEGFAQIGKLIEVWLQTQQAIAAVVTVCQIDLDTFEVDGRKVSEMSNELVVKLKELKTAIEANDTVTLSDALAYEWPTYVDQWDNLLAALSEKV